MESGMVHIICGVLAVALLALIIMRAESAKPNRAKSPKGERTQGA